MAHHAMGAPCFNRSFRRILRSLTFLCRSEVRNADAEASKYQNAFKTSIFPRRSSPLHLHYGAVKDSGGIDCHSHHDGIWNHHKMRHRWVFHTLEAKSPKKQARSLNELHRHRSSATPNAPTSRSQLQLQSSALPYLPTSAHPDHHTIFTHRKYCFSIN